MLKVIPSGDQKQVDIINATINIILDRRFALYDEIADAQRAGNIRTKLELIELDNKLKFEIMDWEEKRNNIAAPFMQKLPEV